MAATGYLDWPCCIVFRLEWPRRFLKMAETYSFDTLIDMIRTKIRRDRWPAAVTSRTKVCVLFVVAWHLWREGKYCGPEDHSQLRLLRDAMDGALNELRDVPLMAPLSDEPPEIIRSSSDRRRLPTSGCGQRRCPDQVKSTQQQQPPLRQQAPVIEIDLISDDETDDRRNVTVGRLNRHRYPQHQQHHHRQQLHSAGRVDREGPSPITLSLTVLGGIEQHSIDFTFTVGKTPRVRRRRHR